MIYLRYASGFGPIGNFLFGMKPVKSFMGMDVSALGWFRRVWHLGWILFSKKAIAVRWLVAITASGLL